MIKEHTLVVLFALLSPLAGYVSYQRLLARVRDGQHIERLALYNSTMLSQWFLFAAFLYVWGASGRPWPLVGVQVSLNLALLVASALTAATIAGLVAQLNGVIRASDDELVRFRGKLGAVLPIIPQSARELRSFRRLSISAGIVEEFLWRGFLLWYLQHYMSLWLAAVVATVAFGLAHAYQGWNKVPQVMLVGAAFTVLYLLTGSLLLPILLHVAVDALQGRLAFEVVTRRSELRSADNVST